MESAITRSENPFTKPLIVIFMMAIESAAIPLPSELIMPLAGWKLIEAKSRGLEWVLLAGFALAFTLATLVSLKRLART